MPVQLAPQHTLFSDQKFQPAVTDAFFQFVAELDAELFVENPQVSLEYYMDGAQLYVNEVRLAEYKDAFTSKQARFLSNTVTTKPQTRFLFNPSISNPFTPKLQIRFPSTNRFHNKLYPYHSQKEDLCLYKLSCIAIISSKIESCRSKAGYLARGDAHNLKRGSLAYVFDYADRNQIAVPKRCLGSNTPAAYLHSLVMAATKYACKEAVRREERRILEKYIQKFGVGKLEETRYSMAQRLESVIQTTALKDSKDLKKSLLKRNMMKVCKERLLEWL